MELSTATIELAKKEQRLLGNIQEGYKNQGCKTISTSNIINVCLFFLFVNVRQFFSWRIHVLQQCWINIHRSFQIGLDLQHDRAVSMILKDMNIDYKKV